VLTTRGKANKGGPTDGYRWEAGNRTCGGRMPQYALRGATTRTKAFNQVTKSTKSNGKSVPLKGVCLGMGGGVRGGAAMSAVTKKSLRANSYYKGDGSTKR